ncbi:transcription initiation factor IIB [Halocatena halophila]|uniref:transcription initiation factor IIB n=1 Tax=Halocatena halophila TaxID=2814576 RepID=UPI002ED00CA2
MLPAQKRRRMHRLRTWNHRSQTPDSKAKYRKQALGEIDRMGSALGLPKDVRETASDIFRQSHQTGIVVGRSIEAVAAAGLHIAAAIASLHRTLDEIAHVARVERTPIARTKRAINAEFNLALEPGQPSTFLERFGSELELQEKSIQKARKILDSASDEYLGSGASPVTIAASALYLGDRLTGGPSVTQKEVGDCCDIYDRVIQDHYPILEEFYKEVC